MPGEPRDWFATSEPTRDHDPTEPTEVDDDVSATGRFDLGRQPTAPVDRTRTIGRYQLEVLLGEGAMGQVWRARDPQLDRAVAIKVVHPSIAASPEASARLRREARAMAKLSHPNVVAVHDAGDDRGRLFVAMELVDGVTLGDRPARRPARRLARGCAAPPGGRPRSGRRPLGGGAAPRLQARQRPGRSRRSGVRRRLRPGRGRRAGGRRPARSATPGPAATVAI
jgi:hypothetical protein